MSESLIDYICETPFMRVVRCLYYSQKPVHLRELVRRYSLSPGGVGDILRRLGELNLVTVTRVRNRKYYTLKPSEEENDLLHRLFSSYEALYINRRKVKLEERASEKLEWMDDAYQFFKNVKQKNVDPT